MPRRLDLRFWLSRLVPMPFRSTYTAELVASADGLPLPSVWVRQRAAWLQWRGRILWHRVTPLGAGMASASG